jgi:flagellar hook-basal body complex protein FliE
LKLSTISETLNAIKLEESKSSNSLKINDDKSFDKMLKDAVNEVNDQQVQGYKAMEGIATGKVTNLQEAVKQIEEAELSLKLALETKNKAINAYKEIMKMQI